MHSKSPEVQLELFSPDVMSFNHHPSIWTDPHTTQTYEETKHCRYHPLAQAVNHSLITPLLPPPFFSYQSSKRPHGLLNSEPSWPPSASSPLHAHGLYEQQQQQAASGSDNAGQPRASVLQSHNTHSLSFCLWMLDVFISIFPSILFNQVILSLKPL